VAVAWTLAFPGVTGAIVGVRRAGQLDAWLSAASLALDDTDLTRIAEAVVRTGVGSGPAVPAHAV
jgi:aryl-alcohol dehydrogenase-like predicted oxidoreductase